MTSTTLLDRRVLVARLLTAVQGDFEGTPYVQALAACLLACDPASVGELEMLDAIYRQQCAAESIEADHLLDVLGQITQVAS